MKHTARETLFACCHQTYNVAIGGHCNGSITIAVSGIRRAVACGYRHGIAPSNTVVRAFLYKDVYLVTTQVAGSCESIIGEGQQRIRVCLQQGRDAVVLCPTLRGSPQRRLALVDAHFAFGITFGRKV